MSFPHSQIAIHSHGHCLLKKYSFSSSNAKGGQILHMVAVHWLYLNVCRITFWQRAHFSSLIYLYLYRCLQGMYSKNSRILSYKVRKWTNANHQLVMSFVSSDLGMVDFEMMLWKGCLINVNLEEVNHHLCHQRIVYDWLASHLDSFADFQEDWSCHNFQNDSTSMVSFQ